LGVDASNTEKPTDYAFVVSMITIIDVLMNKLFDGVICKVGFRDWDRPPCRLLCW
jgi:hypothetical protein